MDLGKDGTWRVVQVVPLGATELDAWKLAGGFAEFMVGLQPLDAAS